MRIARGVSFNGQAYRGWQSQPDGSTVQDKLEAALAAYSRSLHHLRRSHRFRCARPDAGRAL
jgi:tRNA pseudouridine(38-40) synthase